MAPRFALVKPGHTPLHISLAILNAHVLTQDPHRPEAAAVAVSEDRIVLVGSNEEIRKLCSGQTRVIDAGGNTVLPGIIDSHYHLVRGSLRLDNLDLSEVSDLESLTAALRVARDNSGWITGFRLPYGIVPGPRGLTRKELDLAVPDLPAIVFSTDRHVAWANTAALQKAGLLHGGKTGANSEIVMGDDGLATGELREPGAYGPVEKLIPPIDRARKLALIKKGQKQAAAFGITTVHNMDGDTEQLGLLADLENSGDLTLRVLLPARIYPDTTAATLKEIAEWHTLHRGRLLRTGLVKFLLDGVIEGRTAHLISDYADSPGESGASNFEAARFAELANEADRLGLQIAVHAVGDASVRLALKTFGVMKSINGARDRRHRIEHIELVHKDDIKLFKEYGVIAAMQPYHAPLTPPDDAWTRAVGKERIGRAMPWRDLLNGGAVLAFGSDWPVVSQNPFLGIAAALNRKGWSPDQETQAVTLDEAIRAYTTAGAFAGFSENEQGILRPGFLADIVMLDRKLSSTDYSSLAETRALLTITGDRIVFES